MPSSSLPARPNLEQLRNQAKDLLKAYRAGQHSALSRFRDSSRLLSNLTDHELVRLSLSLRDAQRVVAIEYGFPNWTSMRTHVDRKERTTMFEMTVDHVKVNRLSPNPPKDTDGRCEDSGRGVRELQGRWPGLHWGRWEVGGRSSVAAQGPYGRLRELRCAGWRENTQQGTLADRGGASLRGRWVSCRLAVRPGVEWLAAGPRRE